MPNPEVAALDAVNVELWIVKGVLVVGFLWAESINFSKLQLLAFFYVVVIDYVFLVTGHF
jgi:hypothetical protein